MPGHMLKISKILELSRRLFHVDRQKLLYLVSDSLRSSVSNWTKSFLCVKENILIKIGLIRKFDRLVFEDKIRVLDFRVNF
jgi:hypothetical protein